MHDKIILSTVKKKKSKKQMTIFGTHEKLLVIITRVHFYEK